jgi:hypothetical protein
MKKSLILSSLIASIFLSGCLQPPKPYVFKNQYDDNLTKELSEKKGTASISGSAFLRKNSGDIVTCAGQEVYLFPKTSYATEYLSVNYGHTNIFVVSYFDSQKGYKGPSVGLPFDTVYPFSPYVKSSYCDAQGNFEFKNIGDGEYYVATKVDWVVQGAVQGGSLVHSVNVKNNESTTVVVSD